MTSAGRGTGHYSDPCHDCGHQVGVLAIQPLETVAETPDRYGELHLGTDGRQRCPELASPRWRLRLPRH